MNVNDQSEMMHVRTIEHREIIAEIMTFFSTETSIIAATAVQILDIEAGDCTVFAGVGLSTCLSKSNNFLFQHISHMTYAYFPSSEETTTNDQTSLASQVGLESTALVVDMKQHCVKFVPLQNNHNLGSIFGTEIGQCGTPGRLKAHQSQFSELKYISLVRPIHISVIVSTKAVRFFISCIDGENYVVIITVQMNGISAFEYKGFTSFHISKLNEYFYVPKIYVNLVSYNNESRLIESEFEYFLLTEEEWIPTEQSCFSYDVTSCIPMMVRGWPTLLVNRTLKYLQYSTSKGLAEFQGVKVIGMTPDVTADLATLSDDGKQIVLYSREERKFYFLRENKYSFTKKANSVCQTSNFNEYSGKTLEVCAHYCSWLNDKCKAFTYHSKDGICKLHEKYVPVKEPGFNCYFL